ncbi:alanine--tRNA ligase [Candidatus Daviesbacteria bacterium]|nr:alanine--tRNA ligase [Candidatus Daviesbacteria bacterium]
MKSSEVRIKYLEYFQKEPRNHKIIPSSSLVPENDPTTLFTGSGMQPMIQYLLGADHPLGKRIADSQKCFRSQDIDEVGDNRHTTFFEMLGNWSLGDYWKEDQLKWFFEFLTDEKEGLGLDPKKLYFSAFGGDERYRVIENNLPQAMRPDVETVDIWQRLFQEKGINAEIANISNQKPDINKGRIFYYGASKNWWSRSGTPEQMPVGEIGGPDSEVFFDFGEELNFHQNSPWKDEPCHPNCDCGRFLEVGNSVFMQYKKIDEKTFEELPNKNVDFGGGLERLIAATNNEPDVFKTDSFWPIIEKITEQLGVSYDQNPKTTSSLRIIADHIKAATFLIKDGVIPSNKQQGYVLRRLLRRAAIKINQLKENSMGVLPKLVDPVIDIYTDTDYFQTGDWDNIRSVVAGEITKFGITIKHGLKKLDDYIQNKNNPAINGLHAFDLYQSDGFPLELTIEIAQQKNAQISPNILAEFENAQKSHSDLSRKISVGMFKGGLADQTEATTKLHTANHLMQAALRQVLGNHIRQRGSNINGERLRFDFPHPQKLTEEELKKVEDLVNQKIAEDLKVWFDIEEREKAIKMGALTNYGENYPEKSKIYKIGNPESIFSMEFCGGPHVEHTKLIGKFKIIKQESLGSGLRRIYATVEHS